MKSGDIWQRITEIRKKKGVVIGLSIAGILLVLGILGYKMTKNINDTEVAFQVFIRFLVIVTVYICIMLLLCINIMKYLCYRKLNTMLVICTGVIMVFGVFIQISNFELQSPVRNTLEKVFLLSEYDQIQNLCKKEPSENAGKTISLNEINELKAEFEQTYNFTVEDAKAFMEELKEKNILKVDNLKTAENGKSEVITFETDGSADSFVQATIRKYRLETVNAYKQYKIKNADDKNYQENCSDYEEKIAVLSEEENKIAQRHYLIVKNLGLSKILTLRDGEKADADMSISKYAKVYKQMIKWEKISQYHDEMKYMIRNALFSVIFAIIFMVLFGCAYGIYYDVFLHIMIGVQILIFGALLLFGRGSGASIVLGSINILEFTKIIFVFVMTGFIGKSEKNNQFTFFGCFKFNRVFCAIIYIVINCIGFLVLSELGTLISLFMIGILMLFMFTDRKMFAFKKLEWIILAMCGIFLISGIGILTSVYYKYENMIASEEFETVFEREIDDPKANYLALTAEQLSQQKDVDGIIEPTLAKVCQRIYAFIHVNDTEDDFVRIGSGSQGFQMMKARAAADILGPIKNDMNLTIIENSTDAVFAQFIYTSGYLFAFILVVLYMMLVLTSYFSIINVKDGYYRVLGVAIVLLLAFQNIVHIAVNISLFPITGIPLMYVSHGGAIQTVSMMVTCILLLISSGEFERDIKDEKNFDRTIRNIVHHTLHSFKDLVRVLLGIIIVLIGGIIAIDVHTIIGAVILFIGVSVIIGKEVLRKFIRWPEKNFGITNGIFVVLLLVMYYLVGFM